MMRVRDEGEKKKRTGTAADMIQLQDTSIFY